MCLLLLTAKGKRVLC